MPTMTPEMIAQLRDPEFLAQFQTTESLTEYLSAWEKALAQGHTDGKPALDGGFEYLKKGNFPTIDSDSDLKDGKATFLGKKPPRPRELYCHRLGAKGALHRLPNLDWKYIPYDCNQCLECQTWGADLITHRYIRERGPIQTVITVSGFARADSASEWSKKQSTRVSRHHRSHVPRCRLIDRTEDYTYRLIIIYNEGLPERLIELTERAAKRDGLACDTDITSLSRNAFRKLVPLPRSIYNDLRGDQESGRTNTCHFSNWRDWNPNDIDFMLDDGITVDSSDSIPEVQDMSKWEQNRLKMPLEERATANVRDWLAGIDLSHDGLMALRDKRKNGGRGTKAEIQACIASGDWRGPTKLLRDLADALDDDGYLAASERDCLWVAHGNIVGRPA